MYTYHTLVCYCCFDTVFIFIVNLYKYQYVFSNYWLSRSVLRRMSLVQNREIRNMVLLRTFGLLLKWIFFFKFDVFMIGKTTILFFLFTQTSQIDCFRHVHKILLWIGSSNLIFQFVSHPQKSIFLSFILKRYPTIPINK